MSQLEFVVRNFPNFLIGFPGNRPGGLLMTLALSVVGLGLGLIVALLVAAARDANSKILRAISLSYIQVMRGIPLILLLLLMHQMLRGRTAFGLEPPLVSALVTLVLYSGAYQGDIVAAGFRSVPAGVVENARLLGCGPWKVLSLVKLPYSLRVMQPALAGQAITLFKDSSVVVILGVVDLTTTARLALGSNVTNAPHWVATYLTVGAIYFVVAFGLSRFANSWEARASTSGLVRVTT